MERVTFGTGTYIVGNRPEVPCDCSWLLSDFRLRLYPVPLCRFHWHRCRFLALALPGVSGQLSNPWPPLSAEVRLPRATSPQVHGLAHVHAARRFRRRECESSVRGSVREVSISLSREKLCCA